MANPSKLRSKRAVASRNSGRGKALRGEVIIPTKIFPFFSSIGKEGASAA